jgi:hypothetical protein
VLSAGDTRAVVRAAQPIAPPLDARSTLRTDVYLRGDASGAWTPGVVVLFVPDLHSAPVDGLTGAVAGGVVAWSEALTAGGLLDSSASLDDVLSATAPAEADLAVRLDQAMWPGDRDEAFAHYLAAVVSAELDAGVDPLRVAAAGVCASRVSARLAEGLPVEIRAHLHARLELLRAEHVTRAIDAVLDSISVRFAGETLRLRLAYGAWDVTPAQAWADYDLVVSTELSARGVTADHSIAIRSSAAVLLAAMADPQGAAASTLAYFAAVGDDPALLVLAMLAAAQPLP